MYIESHQGQTHNTPQVAFCSDCGTQYYIATFIFVQTRGQCSCSWGCCETSANTNRPHARHIQHRSATNADEVEVAAGRLKDFRGK